MKLRLICAGLLSALLFSCSYNGRTTLPTVDDIDKTMAKGEFTEAAKMIRLALTSDSLSVKERYDLNFKIDLMERIRKDFDTDDTTVVSYLKKYHPQVTPEEIANWEKSNALEHMVIDGKKKYFYAAGRNLFRIDSSAAKYFTEPNGGQSDSLNRFLAWHIPQLVQKAKQSKKSLFDPIKVTIKYTLTIKPDQVPDGEIVRVWMPYPRRDKAAHTGIELLSASDSKYLISPVESLHSSIYMEGKAKAGEPLVFTYEFKYNSFARWYNFAPQEAKPYDTTSAIYKNYTSQQLPHIAFSENIKSAVKEAIGDETNPYLKARKIYEWIDSRFPWASAREYSTIANIPEYVLSNRHGDCGQVSLLFITMARYAGIPAKWESGWMLHPGNKNLHDWAEAYFEGIGWVPVDQSFGRVKGSIDDPDSYYFFTKGLDAYRLIVNDGISGDFYPAKIHPRSETVDFQRGEVEWRGGNLYFGRWKYKMEVTFSL